MNQSKQFEFLSQNINTLKGVGKKIQILLRKKNIEKISDLLWNIPHSFTDRSNLTDLNKLEIGKITTIKVKVTKYNIPRIKNLPNKVICKDEKGEIDIIFFNISSSISIRFFKSLSSESLNLLIYFLTKFPNSKSNSLSPLCDDL